MSAFHRLLQQLGEEHDRELAEVHTRAAAGLDTSCGSMALSQGLARWRPRASGASARMEEEPAVMYDSTGSQDEEIAMVRQFAEKRSRSPLRKSSANSPTQLYTSNRPSSHEGAPVLQPLWQLTTEELNLATDFVQLSPRNQSAGTGLLADLLDGSTGSQEAKAPLAKIIAGGTKGFGLVARLLWDCLGVACILFDLVWIPVQICFAVRGLLGVEWSLRLFWSADLLLKLQQAVASGVKAKRFLAVARSRGLLFDVVIVAMDWAPVVAMSQEGTAPGVLGLLRIGKVPRILRVLRVLRLAWVMKLERFFFALRDHVIASNESVSLLLGVLQNMLCLLLLCHLCSCIWFLVGSGASDEHWVHYYGLHDAPLLVQYLWSFHWVASQWTPAPMEVLPRNNRERAFTTVLVVGGVMVFSTFMGAITASMTRLRNLSGNELSQSFLLRHFLHENRISRSLTVRICRYADLALERQQKRIEQESVRHLRLLSGPLHAELQKEIYLPHLRRHAFFAGYLDWDAAAMGRLCLLALGREFFAKGDVLFSLGAAAARMYCIVGGTFIYQRRRNVRVLPGMTRPKRKVRVPSGVWSCEATLWVLWNHVGSMYALTEGEVVQVDAEKFREVTRSREGVFSRSALYAQAFSHTMLDENDLTWDLPAEMMYSNFCPSNSKQPFWWRGDDVDADVAETEWMRTHASEESEEEEEQPMTKGSRSPMWSETMTLSGDDLKKVQL